MRVPFRQGIIRYPYSGSLQDFLQASGSDINLTADNGPTEVTFAHHNTNYLHIENATVSAAWTSFTSSTDQWLYWDIDLLTGTRTFGITLVAPVFGPTEPTSPTTDLHWYDTINEVMKNYQSGSFSEVARVFAAKFDGVGTFTSLSAGLPNLPFAGSQVGLIDSSNLSGRIIFDDSGTVIIRSSGELFTTEDQFFATGSRVNSVRLESNGHIATATENIAAFNVVKYVSAGKVSQAGYNDTGSTVFGMTVEDIVSNNNGTIILQGVIKNTNWNWTTIGAELWVNGPSNGLLTETDPNITDPVTYLTKQVPVARVLSQTEIIFEQGLGGIGKTGARGPSGLGTDTKATTSQLGVILLSETPVNAEAPIAVGDNDTRMADARPPLSHTQAATTITFSSAGSISAGEVQAAIEELDDEKLGKVGGTLTGLLTLNADPTNILHAATKQYVDGLVSGLLWQEPIHYVNMIDDGLTTSPTLTASDASNVYITAGVGGSWSGFAVGSIVVWDGSSWSEDVHEGLLSGHTTGTRFGISMRSDTAAAGSFVGKDDYIAVLTNPATPTWSFIAPVSDHAVFVNNDESLHAYHQYVYNDYLTKWVEISKAGTAIVASEVNFTPVGNLSSTDVQAALAELDATPIPYDVAGQVVDKPDASAIVLRFVAARAFTIASSGHQAIADVASAGTAVFDIKLNAGSIGSITFTASTTGVTSVTQTTVSIGDVITVIAPGSQDGTLADIGFTLFCTI